MAKTKEFRTLTLKEAWPHASSSVRNRRFTTLIFALLVGAVLWAGSLSFWLVIPIALAGGIVLHVLGVLSNVASPVDGIAVCIACGHQRRLENVRVLRQQNVVGNGRCGICRHEIGKES